jgi:hypothetical protein
MAGRNVPNASDHWSQWIILVPIISKIERGHGGLPVASDHWTQRIKGGVHHFKEWERAGRATIGRGGGAVVGDGDCVASSSSPLSSLLPSRFLVLLTRVRASWCAYLELLTATTDQH